MDMNNLPVPDSNEVWQFKGVPVQCGPWGWRARPTCLYHNRGDGTFEEVSRRPASTIPTNITGSVQPGVIDNDGWPDLFVADDATPNHLYHKQSDGTSLTMDGQRPIAMNSEDRRLVRWVSLGATRSTSGRLSMFITEFAVNPTLSTATSRARIRRCGDVFASGASELAAGRWGPRSLIWITLAGSICWSSTDTSIRKWGQCEGKRRLRRADAPASKSSRRTSRCFEGLGPGGDADEIQAGAAFGDIANNGTSMRGAECASRLTLLNTNQNSNHR